LESLLWQRAIVWSTTLSKSRRPDREIWPFSFASAIPHEVQARHNNNDVLGIQFIHDPECGQSFAGTTWMNQFASRLPLRLEMFNCILYCTFLMKLWLIGANPWNLILKNSARIIKKVLTKMAKFVAQQEPELLDEF
jgi:hypothetical protein